MQALAQRRRHRHTRTHAHAHRDADASRHWLRGAGTDTRASNNVFSLGFLLFLLQNVCFPYVLIWFSFKSLVFLKFSMVCNEKQTKTLKNQRKTKKTLKKSDSHIEKPKKQKKQNSTGKYCSAPDLFFLRSFGFSFFFVFSM